MAVKMDCLVIGCVAQNWHYVISLRGGANRRHENGQKLREGACSGSVEMDGGAAGVGMWKLESQSMKLYGAADVDTHESIYE